MGSSSAEVNMSAVDGLALNGQHGPESPEWDGEVEPGEGPTELTDSGPTGKSCSHRRCRDRPGAAIRLMSRNPTATVLSLKA